MKRVGIITLYHNNQNYGGLLQAYAMFKAIDKLGIEAKQISFDFNSSSSPILPSRIQKFKKNPVGFFINHIDYKLHKLVYAIRGKKKERIIADSIKERSLAFKNFEESIPHTQTTQSKDLNDLNKYFDIFICGSDQIWNPSLLRDAYLLTFVEQGKIKISYAASFGRDTLSNSELQYISQKLDGYNAISVREISAKWILEKVISKSVSYVVDPTLLLDRNEWEELSEPYNISQPYVLAYFLGDSEKQRTSTQIFAKRKGLKIVGFPHILGKYRHSDENFADIDLYNVSPLQFVYLISHAEYIITDSFHACVFSIIFKKNFVVFERQTNTSEERMNSRILSLLEITNLQHCLMSPDEFYEIENIDYGNMEEFENLKSESYEFLKKALL